MGMDKTVDVSVEHITQRVYFVKMGFYFVLNIYCTAISTQPILQKLSHSKPCSLGTSLM